MGKRKFGKSTGGNTKLLKQAQEMQKNMMKLQEGLSDVELKSSTGGGLVELTANGQGDVTAIKINHEMLEIDADDAEALEDSIMAALTDISEQVKKISEDQMSQLTGGKFNLPGMF